jgi:hypothetical protein
LRAAEVKVQKLKDDGAIDKPITAMFGSIFPDLTPLMDAAYNNRVIEVGVLIDFGANVNAKNICVSVCCIPISERDFFLNGFSFLKNIYFTQRTSAIYLSMLILVAFASFKPF